MYGREAFAAGTPLLQALGNIALLTGKAGRANNGLTVDLPRRPTAAARSIWACGPTAAPATPI